MDFFNEYGITPDITVDVSGRGNNDPAVTRHKHVAIALGDGSVLWLDIDTETAADHNYVDIRWFNDKDEMKGTGVFTIVNGQRMSLSGYGETKGVEDTKGRVVKGHGWVGGYVTTLLVDKNGEEETAIKPSDGNG